MTHVEKAEEFLAEVDAYNAARNASNGSIGDPEETASDAAFDVVESSNPSDNVDAVGCTVEHAAGGIAGDIAMCAAIAAVKAALSS